MLVTLFLIRVLRTRVYTENVSRGDNSCRRAHPFRVFTCSNFWFTGERSQVTRTFSPTEYVAQKKSEAYVPITGEFSPKPRARLKPVRISGYGYTCTKLQDQDSRSDYDQVHVPSPHTKKNEKKEQARTSIYEQGTSLSIREVPRGVQQRERGGKMHLLHTRV